MKWLTIDFIVFTRGTIVYISLKTIKKLSFNYKNPNCAFTWKIYMICESNATNGNKCIVNSFAPLETKAEEDLILINGVKVVTVFLNLSFLFTRLS